MDGAATDAKLGAYALFKANTAKFGIPMVRLFAGYHGNWRQSAKGVDFLGRVNGFRAGAEISGIVDKTFALGLMASMTTSHRGLFDFGAFMSQRLSQQAKFGTWSMRFGVNVSLLRQEFEDVGMKLENWLTFSGGINVAI
jgi:hypothetical protein